MKDAYHINKCSILTISLLAIALVGCGSDDSSDTPPILTGVYYSNEGGILLALGDKAEALFNNIPIKSSNTIQDGNTLKITQLTDPTGINDYSNKQLTASFDGSGMQVSGFDTTTYLYRLPGNHPVAGDFAGSYDSDMTNWVINSDNTFTATSITSGCLLTGELVYGPLYYIVANAVATSCTDNRYNGNYPDGYAVYGDFPNGKDWLGVVIWREGAALWDNVPLN